jgi:hypothetical protein
MLVVSRVGANAEADGAVRPTAGEAVPDRDLKLMANGPRKWQRGRMRFVQRK